MTKTPTITVTILRTTDNNAKLITDGNRVAWVQGQYVRPDNTLTPCAVRALAIGTPVDLWEKQEAERQKEREEREAKRKEAREQSALPIIITILPKYKVVDYSPKAWKFVATGEYLPKSLVSIATADGATIMTMPRWLLRKNYWLRSFCEMTDEVYGVISGKGF